MLLGKYRHKMMMEETRWSRLVMRCCISQICRFSQTCGASSSWTCYSCEPCEEDFQSRLRPRSLVTSLKTWRPLSQTCVSSSCSWPPLAQALGFVDEVVTSGQATPACLLKKMMMMTWWISSSSSWPCETLPCLLHCFGVLALMICFGSSSWLVTSSGTWSLSPWSSSSTETSVLMDDWVVEVVSMILTLTCLVSHGSCL